MNVVYIKFESVLPCVRKKAFSLRAHVMISGLLTVVNDQNAAKEGPYFD